MESHAHQNKTIKLYFFSLERIVDVTKVSVYLHVVVYYESKYEQVIFQGFMEICRRYNSLLTLLISNVNLKLERSVDTTWLAPQLLIVYRSMQGDECRPTCCLTICKSVAHVGVLHNSLDSDSTTSVCVHVAAAWLRAVLGAQRKWRMLKLSHEESIAVAYCHLVAFILWKGAIWLSVLMSKSALFI